MSQLPRSVTNLYINGAALLISVLALYLLIRFDNNLAQVWTVLLLCAAYGLPVIALEAIFLRPRGNNIKSGPPRSRSIDTGFLLVKILGLILTCALALGVYWLFPEYHGHFYNLYYTMLESLAPWFAALVLPYFLLMQRLRGNEKDGYWHMGQLAILNLHAVDWHCIWQHSLGWLVKVFFLPLMFTYLGNKIGYMRGYDFSSLFTDFRTFYDFSYQTLFYFDVLIVTVGYMCTFTVTDSHIRSTEATFLGWTAALVCYQPFWSLLSSQYLDYSPGRNWGSWFWGHELMYVLWGSTIILLIAIYTWASLSFGIRFSNLTHRGILTNGPYRYCKHPAYVSKCLSYWLVSMPFMINSNPAEAARHCMLLLLLNFIYLIRARTEERHLSQDPDYVAYAQYMEARGMLRFIGHYVPVLRFKPRALFNTTG